MTTEKKVSTETPLMIQLTNLLHQHRDPEAQAVRDFVSEHSKDAVFMRRAKTLIKLFKT